MKLVGIHHGGNPGSCWGSLGEAGPDRRSSSLTSFGSPYSYLLDVGSCKAGDCWVLEAPGRAGKDRGAVLFSKIPCWLTLFAVFRRKQWCFVQAVAESRTIRQELKRKIAEKQVSRTVTQQCSSPNMHSGGPRDVQGVQRAYSARTAETHTRGMAGDRARKGDPGAPNSAAQPLGLQVCFIKRTI